MPTLIGQSDDPNAAGVLGEGGTGVYGRNTTGTGNGVIGYSDDGRGVWGHANAGHGVLGESVTGRGVVGTSETDYGIRGHSNMSAGIRGSSGASRGVEGWSTTAEGVHGISQTGNGVWGHTEAGTGVVGTSAQGAGVTGRGPMGGVFEGGSTAGVHAVNLGNGPAILAKGGGGTNQAGFFDGNVHVTQTVTTFDVLIAGSDCAEDFDIVSSARIEPGTVMVIGDDARLVESHRAYDKRVAGIVSGAGDYKPGIVLGKDAARQDRVPLALIGKVFCKVDATYGRIEVGDLLTTSPTQGHAMKAEDPAQAFGAVVGKALAPLGEGRSLLPILVALQ